MHWSAASRGDPKLGVHNGLPVTVIVSTTLQGLAAGAGRAMTGGGTPKPSFVFRPRSPHRLGSQRVVLYAKDRGCTAPGCDVPGYWTEVHHVDDWARGGRTDIDKLTLACKARPQDGR
jgi:hypothetical protein